METSDNHFGLRIVILAIAMAAWQSGVLFSAETGAAKEGTGMYFAKKAYEAKPLPKFAELRSQLPSPIYDDNPVLVRLYWKAWELAFHNFYEPAPQSGFVSQFIDPAFNKNIFLWDSCFMTMFCNYAYPLVPGISSLDNFYAKQHEDGEICREIVRNTGTDFDSWVNHEDKPLISRWGWPGYDEMVGAARSAPVVYTGRTIPSPNPRLTLDGLNHPILAWAELEHYRVTGDKDRLEEVWQPLVHYYAALQLYLRQGNGLYVTDWASMDNSPRNAYLKNGGTGIDISSEMALFARQLSEMGLILGKDTDARKYSAEADQLDSAINHAMWDGNRKFYFDLMLDGKRAPVMTIAAYWTLLAGVASSDQAADLVTELKNPETFGRSNLVPTLAANQAGYEPLGGYWRGSVWAPTDTMIMQGLEKYGYSDLARHIALNHLELVAHVYEKTGTIWENYSPDHAQQGNPAKSDFVGWSGIGPIMYLLEYAIGLRPDAAHNRLVWRIEAGGQRGCERFRFNGHVVSLIAGPATNGSKVETIHVQSDSPFELHAYFQGAQRTFMVKAGKQKFDITGISKE
ncbi:conserved exported hypothetical protein [Acidobacteriia bacterium SbA2]|nr:conserved exported hypothetical protein [Acidobacteriia bacterium SbA2]